MDEKIRRLVSYYIQKYNTTDPFELAECLNVLVLRFPLGKLDGQYKYLKHTRCIIINSDIDDVNYARIVAAHELGHAIIHTKMNCCFMRNNTLLSTSKVERQANLFAAELLIPDSLLFEYAGYTIEQIACNEGLNKELLELKFL